jgi:hypothetical protein
MFESVDPVTRFCDNQGEDGDIFVIQEAVSKVSAAEEGFYAVAYP